MKADGRFFVLVAFVAALTGIVCGLIGIPADLATVKEFLEKGDTNPPPRPRSYQCYDGSTTNDRSRCPVPPPPPASNPDLESPAHEAEPPKNVAKPPVTLTPAPAPPPVTLTPAPAPPPVTATVQFSPSTYSQGMFAIRLAPCSQTGEALECDVHVTAGQERGSGWMIDRRTNVQDEFGVPIVPTWVAMQGKTYYPDRGGHQIWPAPGVDTLVRYHFDNIRDATKLQSLSLTFCCTRAVPFPRQP